MAKRLTLTEYRQENAVFLSNEYPKSRNCKYNEIERYICDNYVSYINFFGIDNDLVIEIAYRIQIMKEVDLFAVNKLIEEILAYEVKHEMD